MKTKKKVVKKSKNKMSKLSNPINPNNTADFNKLLENSIKKPLL